MVNYKAKRLVLLAAASLSCCPTRPSLPEPILDGKVLRYPTAEAAKPDGKLVIKMDENIMRDIGILNEKPLAVFNLDTSYVVFGKKVFAILPKPGEKFSPYWEAAGRGLPKGFEVFFPEASHSDYWEIGVHLNGKYYGHYRVRDGKAVPEKK